MTLDGTVQRGDSLSSKVFKESYRGGGINERETGSSPSDVQRNYRKGPLNME